ncbi:hypothetical protein ACF0H5_019364 [Mactra antiquata]
MDSLWLTTLLCCILIHVSECNVGGDLVQLTTCSARLGGKLIKLEGIKKRLVAEFIDSYNGSWHYMYHPCEEFNLPNDPDEGYGDNCLSVALCKYSKQSGRQYFYTLGFQNKAQFQLYENMNGTGVQIVYQGFRSMRSKTTYVKLICDNKRSHEDDADFTIVRDLKGLGDVHAELRHVSCCLDGYKQLQEDSDDSDDVDDVNTSNSSDTSVVTNKDNHQEVDRTKVMIIVGVNVGVILMAGVVGLMCYNKRSHVEIYSKLPGVRATPEWQIPMDGDVEQPVSMSGPIISTARPGQHVPQSSKSEYRDGAPNNRRKSLCFPVLEHCGIPEECLSLGQRLGGGIFGDTYLGEWTGITVAVKRVTLSVHEYQTNQENITEMQKHVAFLSNQRHRNIVSILGYCSESKHPYIIAEYITGQVMKDFVKCAGTQLTWPHRVKILSQVADGMAFLHSTHPPILHRDLRCANMFITNNDVVKVCDFGILKIIQPLRAGCKLDECCCQGRYSACPPSISWTAPEVLQHPNACEESEYTQSRSEDINSSDDDMRYITTAVDVYSFGIIMWELMSGDDPYEDMPTAQEVMEYVISGGRPDFSQHIPVLEPYVQLAANCWDVRRNVRPNFKQVTVRLKEIHHQAKLFQKNVSFKGARPRTRSKTLQVSFCEEEKTAR